MLFNPPIQSQSFSELSFLLTVKFMSVSQFFSPAQVRQVDYSGLELGISLPPGPIRLWFFASPKGGPTPLDPENSGVSFK